MELPNNNSLLIIVGIIAIIIELILGVATGFDLLLIGVIFITSGAVGVVTNNFSIALGLVFFLAIFYIIIGRRFVKKSLFFETQKTNSDNLIGKNGQVVKKITTVFPGQVKVEGEVWRAQADNDIDEGVEVVVQSVTGVTVKVRPI